MQELKDRDNAHLLPTKALCVGSLLNIIVTPAQYMVFFKPNRNQTQKLCQVKTLQPNLIHKPPANPAPKKEK